MVSQCVLHIPSQFSKLKVLSLDFSYLSHSRLLVTVAFFLPFLVLLFLF